MSSIDLSGYVPNVALYLVGYAVSYIIYPELIDSILNRYPKLFEDDEGEPEIELGRVIGQLERLLIITSVYSNKYSLIPMLLTAKSIVRFPTISESRMGKKFAEYYLVGTLTSFLLAIATGVVIVEYLKNLHAL